jgi:outer membrane lipoprotein SlyB
MNNPTLQPSASSSFSRPAALIGGAVALVAITAIATTLAIKPSVPAAADAGASMAAQSLASSTKASGEVGDDGPAAKPAPAQAERPAQATPKPAAKPAPAKVVAATCATCGVIESVTPFEKKGEGSGVGAVGGAVVGGLIGNQMGSGKATTLYSVKVRMDDGTTRTITQSTAPTVGQKVTVDGSTIKARA